MSRSMIKQQNSGATAHVVLYTPRQSSIIYTHIYCMGASIKLFVMGASPKKGPP